MAAGLAWLARADKDGDDLAGVRAHLESESKESLVEILVEQAANDSELRARLEAAALREKHEAKRKFMPRIKGLK